MSLRKIYRKIAKENGTTVDNVRQEMQEAINYAYKNNKSKNTVLLREQIPSENAIATPDEVIRFATSQIKGKKQNSER